jgi:drug/metabolite transporter (DMT)-like permease
MTTPGPDQSRPAPASGVNSATDLALLIVAAAAVSTSAPLIRLAAAPTLAIALWRNVLSLPVVGLVAAAQIRDDGLHLGRRARRLAIVAGIVLGIHFAAFIPSVSFTSVASSVALVSTMPIWSAVIDRLRGEPVPGRVWTGIATAMAGVVLLTGVDVSISARALFGDVLALAGGVLAAVYVQVGAEVRRTISTSLYATICYSVAAALLLVICLVSGQELWGYTGGTWLALAAMAAGPQLLGHTVFNRVLRTTGPTVVSIMVLLEMVGATILAWVLFDEAPPLLAYPAAALIIGGVVVVLRTGQEPLPEAPVAPLAAD